MIRVAGMFGLMLVVLAGCGDSRDDDRRGGLCGVSGLQGEERRSFREGACGISNPVAVTRVAGVRLTQPALLSCPAARALNRWTRTVAKPAGEARGGLVSMRVAASYACRTRNHRPGARLSEHAKGNAIDFSAFFFENGTSTTVLDGWNGARRDRRFLRELHKGACGPFGTVLGPNSDRYHRDHFHFDVASYRSGAYCR